MKLASRHLSTGDPNTSFLATFRPNRTKVAVLVTVAAALIAVEALGYFRDVERPKSVNWLFRPKAD